MSSGIFLALDQDVCMGAGYCAKASPRLFELADDGVSEIRASDTGGGPIELEPDDVTDARHCANICPASAIEVTPQA